MNLGYLSLVSFDPPPGIGFHFSEPNRPESKAGMMWCWVIALFLVSGLFFCLSDFDQTQKAKPVTSSSAVVERKDEL